MIHLDTIPSKIVADKGTKAVKIKTTGKEKEGFTIGPTITMSGIMLRYTPYLAIKRSKEV